MNTIVREIALRLVGDGKPSLPLHLSLMRTRCVVATRTRFDQFCCNKVVSISGINMKGDYIFSKACSYCYFIDVQIWYLHLETCPGGQYGMCVHLLKDSGQSTQVQGRGPLLIPPWKDGVTLKLHPLPVWDTIMLPREIDKIFEPQSKVSCCLHT